MKVTVKPIRKKDAGRGLAAIPRSVMRREGIDKEDYVLISSIEGAGKTIARAFPGYNEDEGEAVVRVDGDIRGEAGVTIDDEATVKQVDVSPAQSITVALPEDVRIKGDIGPTLLDHIQGIPAEEGDAFTVSLGFGDGEQTIPMHVISTDPDQLVVINEETKITVERRKMRNGGHQPESDESSASKSTRSSSSGVTYEDIGGVDEELEHVREMVELPMQYPEVFQRLGIDPPKGVLLHGPPGTGKTMIAKAVANEVDAEFFNINGPEILSNHMGDSTDNLQEIFEEAQEKSPAIVFMDELDAIVPERGETNYSGNDKMVNQLLSLMDGLEGRGEVVVIGATNRPDTIDPALRRGGRFDREIEIGVPDKDGREEVLHIHTRDMPLSEGVDIERYAERTHGFVGADLESLAKESAMHAMRRLRPNIDLNEDSIDARLLNSLNVTEDDFDAAMRETEPSAMREVFVEVPDVTWDDVGGLEDTKMELQEVVQWPLSYDFLFEEANINGASGVLLHGPPGTGKTLMAKAVANESDANFISIKGPEIMSKWVGEAEERIRETFEKARSNAPTVIFFDEIDSIAGERGGGGDSNEVTERVVAQLLTELDGLEALENVVVIAATNRPELIDDALRRSGRFDKEIKVGMPDHKTRKEIFGVHISDKQVASGVSAGLLADKTDGYVGADIEAICEEAGMLAMRDFVSSTPEDNLRQRAGDMELREEHFDRAIDKVEPSVDDDTVGR